MKFVFWYKKSKKTPFPYSKWPAAADGCIGYGEDAEAALKDLFGRVTDELLDGIERWEILTGTRARSSVW